MAPPFLSVPSSQSSQASTLVDAEVSARSDSSLSGIPKDLLVVGVFLLAGAILSIVDNRLGFHTILVESVHALVVTLILVFCWWCQKRYPEVGQVGWNQIVWGCVCLMIGSWIDILDDPPMLALFQWGDNPFGRTWEQAFLKKILGYTVGIGLIAYGFFKWIPWMIQTRLTTQALNQRLSQANSKLNRLLHNMDERIEAERLNISRELHDDVAQRLTAMSYRVQLCQHQAKQSSRESTEEMTVGVQEADLQAMSSEISETLQRVRDISRDLRPEPLFALGLAPALEQFLEKRRQLHPHIQFTFEYAVLPDASNQTNREGPLPDRQLLHLFRIIQESIRNAAKHSQGTEIHVALTEEQAGYTVTISDNGVGLPWNKMPSDAVWVQDGHLGIVGMKERVQELQGTLTLSPNEPHGTVINIVVKPS